MESQRTRLHVATVAVVAERGYEAATVADITGLAGVSRSSFYSLFPDKQECFTATVLAFAESVRGALSEVGSEDLESKLLAYLELMASYPAAARISLVELWALGPDGADINDVLVRDLQAALLAEHATPREVTRALLGGLYKVLHPRVLAGSHASLPAQSSELATWVRSYEAPSERLRRPRSSRPLPASGPQFAALGSTGRLFDALVRTSAELGYSQVTVEMLAGRAGVSLRTFYDHFDSKRALLLATYEAGTAQSQALALPAVERADSWPEGLRAGLEVLLAFLAGGPEWAQLALAGALAAGAEAMEASNRTIDAYASLLAPGLAHNPALSPIAMEATAGAVYTTMYEHLRRRGAERLPEVVPLCTYLALAPFLGSEQATAVANQR